MVCRSAHIEYIHIHIAMYMHIHTYTYTYIHIYIDIYIYIHTFLCVYIYIDVDRSIVLVYRFRDSEIEPAPHRHPEAPNCFASLPSLPAERQKLHLRVTVRRGVLCTSRALSGPIIIIPNPELRPNVVYTWMVGRLSKSA